VIKTDCSKYRGTSLLPATYKILSNMLSRLTPYAEEMIGDIHVDLNVTDELLII
jgi:hypothetical protein